MRRHEVARRYSGQWEMPLTEMRAGSGWPIVRSESAVREIEKFTIPLNKKTKDASKCCAV